MPDPEGPGNQPRMSADLRRTGISRGTPGGGFCRPAVGAARYRGAPDLCGQPGKLRGDSGNLPPSRRIAAGDRTGRGAHQATVPQRHPGATPKPPPVADRRTARLADEATDTA